MKKLRGSAILMMIAILGITGFQVWWLKNNYEREKQNLDIKTNAAFRQTILQLQSSKLKLEKISMRVDSPSMARVTVSTKKPTKAKINKPVAPREPAITMINLIEEKMRDSILAAFGGARAIMIVKNDSTRKAFTDSIKRIAGKIKTISISQQLDSLMTIPGFTENVHVGEGTRSSERSITVVNDGKRGRSRRDSFSFRGEDGEDVFIENHFPFPPTGEMPEDPRRDLPKNNAVFRFLYDMDSLSLKDSVTVKEIESAFTKRLKEDKVDVNFRVKKLDSTSTLPANTVTIGFTKPTSFGLSLQNTFRYMFDKLKLPLLFSLLLVGITIASFVLLYRNMMKQRRLTEFKNEFISNITHELKTPIATVGVAIEALKSFNAIHDPKRTEEYLTISQNELQRLNLLVDKVLKLSMFEKKEIELKYETLNLKDVVDEVLASMRLQVEKYRATVLLNLEGECFLQADRMHLLSVVFNLLDNALKYGNQNPDIRINLEEKEKTIVMQVSDNGIGISPDYKDKVFDKFFRIPHGDTHNAKGYGLGLSYVAHVVKKHGGTITVESETGKGANFIITLPKQIA